MVQALNQNSDGLAEAAKVPETIAPEVSFVSEDI
jgi:hypothetical protein